MLTALGHRAYVRGLQGGPDLRAGYRAPAAVRLKHNRLERSLAKPLPRQARVSEDRPGVVPGLAGVGLEHLMSGAAADRDTAPWSFYAAGDRRLSVPSLALTRPMHHDSFG